MSTKTARIVGDAVHQEVKRHYAFYQLIEDGRPTGRYAHIDTREEYGGIWYAELYWMVMSSQKLSVGPNNLRSTGEKPVVRLGQYSHVKFLREWGYELEEGEAIQVDRTE